jgi:hypothetical protein
MFFSVHVVLNLTILLAAFAVILRFKRIPLLFIPFAILMCIASFNELLSLLLILNGYENALNSNIYVLPEFLIFCFQFMLWGTLSRKGFSFIVILGLAVWVTDNIIVHNLQSNNSLFRITYSFALVLLGIDQAGQLIIFEKGRLTAQPVFLICTGIFIYFGFKTFTEVFNVFDIGLSNEFYYYLWFTLSVVNAFTNILFTVAIVCIPRKQEFILPYW